MHNPNATYKCTAQNDWGTAEIEKSNEELSNYSEPVVSADMGIIIGVAVAAVVVLAAIGFLIYRYVLDPHSSDKDSYPGPDYTAGGHRDHYVGGSQNVYR